MMRRSISLGGRWARSTTVVMADKKRGYKDGFGSSKEWTERELLPEMNDCTSPEMSRPGGGRERTTCNRLKKERKGVEEADRTR